MTIARLSPAARDAPIQLRARQIFQNQVRQLHVRIDQMFVVLMCAQWVIGVVIALWLTPLTRHGREVQSHPSFWMASLLGGLLASVAAAAGIRFPGRRGTRHLIALCQVGFSSLLVHLTGGRIETHFHVFGSLALLAAYRDWKVLVAPTVLVALDSLCRGIFFPDTAFGVLSTGYWRWPEHAVWILLEELWLIIRCRQGIREMDEVAHHQAEMEQSHLDLEQQTNALAEALKERGAIVEGALDAVIQMDGKARIMGWNSQATRIFGWTETEAIGRPFVETIISAGDRADRRGEAGGRLSADISKVLNQRIDVDAVRRSSEIFPIELAITPLENAGRTSYCAFVRDISDRRQAEERLKQAKEAAESANQAKSLFLANMSHEIRTPLNAILGFTDLLRTSDDQLPEVERNAHLEAIHRGGAHLLTIINDILDLSKIEAGQMQYERIRFSPHQVIVDVLSFMRVRAAEKGLSLEARWLGRVPESICSDPARFRQLLLNLTGNAIKFTEHGSVQILARVNAATEMLQVEIIDTGVGIPAQKVDSLFTPFTQADVSVTRRFGGTGLGLSICRHIAHGLGGGVAVQSVEGQGSTFIATISTGSLSGITLLDTPPQEILRTPARSGGGLLARLDGMKVLVVDDGETNRRLLQLLLVRAGAAVETAEHGQEALERTARRSFDAILMDMQMPVMDGYSATHELRARGLATPIIALTAHAMSGEEQKCRAAGCDVFLTKPVNREELVSVLARYHAASGISTECAPPVVPQPAPGRTAREGIRSTLDLTDPEIQDIVSEFVARLGCDLKHIGQAWKARDWTALDDLSHTLKGTAAMTGFPVLSAIAGRVEDLSVERNETDIAASLDALESLVRQIGGAGQFP